LGENTGALLGIENMPQIEGLEIPDVFFLVTREPAPLAGMQRPTSETPWKSFHRIGLQQVVCLTEAPPFYQSDPLAIAGHFPLQDLYNGITPVNPVAEADRIQKAANRIASLLNRKIGVLVHCAGGTGRTGTVIGCVLRRLGYNASDIISYLDQINRQRGSRKGWPESQWQAEMIQKYLVSS
jgi:hypothetical protein